MNRIFITLTSALVFLPLAAAAQQAGRPPLSINPSEAAADPSVYISAHEIADRIAKARAERKSGLPDNKRTPLLVQPSIEVDMEYRHGPADQVRKDEGSANLYVVFDGAGTMTIGGNLIDPTREGATLLASKAQGGTPYKLRKGDILVVPANAAHQVTETEGDLAMMAVRIPIGAPNLWPGGNRFFAASGDPNIYISAREIEDRMAKADAAIKTGLPDGGPFRLLSQPPFRVTMDDRTVPNPHIDAHGFTAELFFVLDGSGTVVVGGKLDDPKGQGNDVMAPSTEGGTLYKVHKGDIVLVPVNAAHAVTHVDGKLTMMQVHIPPAPSSQWTGTGGPPK
jgi:mannose-6-phosphate isomerase-like protein (cupin superfamily)